jgi:AhpD family alkylhydroperoxidase
MLDAMLTFANALRDRTVLDPKLRELAILVVGHATGAQYEVAHHISHALKAGVTKEQINAVESFENSPAFGAVERAVMRVAHESTVAVDVSEETWRQLAAHLSVREQIELAHQIAWYNGACRIMALVRLDLEDDYVRDPVVAGGVSHADGDVSDR